MTTIQTPLNPPTPSDRANPSRRNATRHLARGGRAPVSRVATVVVLLAGLGFSVLARIWAMSLQVKAAADSPYASAGTAAGGAAGRTASFGNMDSFALALLLGGLRGPLVMFLWIESESQKNDRDLQDVNTMIEWIRLLQPEFDRVHIFQIWNMAFNISVQMPSLPDRYRAILEALDYANRMDLAKPDDINLLLALDMLYNGKMGSTSTDKIYYIRQVREDTSYHESRPAAAGGPRRHVDTMLDPAGNLLPQLVQPRHTRPPNLPARIVVPAEALADFDRAAAAAGVKIDPGRVTVVPVSTAISHLGDHILAFDEDQAKRIEAVAGPLTGVLYLYSDFNEGSELQYLPRYAPYKYGLSPLALGFNYAKRAQVLMTLGGQLPEQMGKTVVDSKPGQELRQWADDEWDRASEAEAQLFGKPPNPAVNQSDRQMPTARSHFGEALFATSQNREEIAKARESAQVALDSYALAARLCRDSRAEYVRHLNNPEFYINKFLDYASTLDSLRAAEEMVSGDHDFVAALLAGDKGDDAARRKAMQSSADFYHEAILAYEYQSLRYYLPVEILKPALEPKHYERDTLFRFRTEDPAGFQQFYDMISKTAQGDANFSERVEYSMYINRATQREAYLRSLLAAGGGVPGTEPSQTVPPSTRSSDEHPPQTAPTTGPVSPVSPSADIQPAGGHELKP